MKDDLKPISDLLDVIGKEMVAEAKKNLEIQGRKASGELIRSVNYAVNKNDNGTWTLEIVINPPGDRYVQYTEIGRPPGRQPPVDNIKQWIREKAIGIPQSAAWPIAKTIGKKGYRGRPVFVPLARKYEPVLGQELQETSRVLLEKFIADNFTNK